MDKLIELQNAIAYKFINQKLLKQALSHKSYGKNNYERLEFVGDGILDYTIALELYNKFIDMDEGSLSKLRARLVNQETLVEIAKQISLGNYLFFLTDYFKLLSDELIVLFNLVYLKFLCFS